MSTFDNNNQGAIWGNDDRKTDKHPHFKGSAEVNGVEYWVSAWKREEGANPKAPSLKFKFTPKEEAHNAGMSEAKQAVEPTQEEFDDDIPFVWAMFLPLIPAIGVAGNVTQTML